MKRLLFINIVITIAVFIGNFFYQGLNFNYPLKILCSSGFALMGIINMLYAHKKIENKKVLIFMTLGLIFAFLGDVAINPNFILGVIFFALGHVFFVASYLVYKKINKLDIMLSAGLGVFSISFIIFFPYIVFDVAVLKYVVLVYAVIISVMVGKSVGNGIREKNLFSGMIGIGSILFFISDMMLLLAWFSSIEGRWTSNVCMAAYYPGLCLLASSMVIYIRDDRVNMIARVMQMEEYFDNIMVAVESGTNIRENIKIKEMIKSLKDYQESGQWQKDFICDEKGRLPSDLKRGVLSEDGLFNLLMDVETYLKEEKGEEGK